MDNTYVRGRAFNLTLLAHAHADAGDISAACAAGHQAVDLAEHLNSDRAIRYLKEFQSSLSGASTSAEVIELNARLTTLAA